MPDRLHQETLVRLPRDHRRTRLAPLQHGLAGIEPEPALVLGSRMALVAPLDQERADPSFEVVVGLGGGDSASEAAKDRDRQEQRGEPGLAQVDRPHPDEPLHRTLNNYSTILTVRVHRSSLVKAMLAFPLPSVASILGPIGRLASAVRVPGRAPSFRAGATGRVQNLREVCMLGVTHRSSSSVASAAYALAIAFIVTSASCRRPRPEAGRAAASAGDALGDERASHGLGGPGRGGHHRGRQPGPPGGRRLCRGPGRRGRRDRRGRVPDARLAPPPLRRHGPRPEGQDDPPQGRRVRLAAGPRRRLRRAADHGQGPRGFRRGGGRRDLGRQRRGLPYHRGPDHGAAGQHLLDRRAAHGRLHGRQPREGRHGLPRRQRHGHPGGTRRGPRHRGQQGRQCPSQRLPRRGDLPLSRLRHDDQRLRRAELPRRRHQLPAVERRHRDRLRQRGQHRPRPPPRQRLAAPRGAQLRGPAQRHRRPVPLLARPSRRVRGQSPGSQRPVRHLDRPQGLGQLPGRQPGPPQCRQRRVLPRRGRGDVAAPQSPEGQSHRGQRP